MTDRDRSTFEPVQQRQFSGMHPAPLPSAERVAALKAEVAAHRAARPVMPWPLPPPGSEEYTRWFNAHAAWVDTKDRLTCALEQAEGLLRSAWRPCAPPAHALGVPSVSEAAEAPPAPARRPRKPRAAAEPSPSDEPAEAPKPRRIGRPPLIDTDDPKVLSRRAQYRASAAKQQARRIAQRSGVIR